MALQTICFARPRESPFIVESISRKPYDWVAGISIGAVNSALIAGNPPEKRVERLREFWETVCA
jgi:hypothetical protein